jgi:ribosomal protein L7/L12
LHRRPPLQQIIIDKFNKLRFKISFETRASHSSSELEVLNDMDWVKRQIEDLSGGIVLDKIELLMANLYWKKYSSGVESTDKQLWSVIDHHIEAGYKISAIKMYRRFIDSGLRDAKNAVDAREMKNKGLI